MSYSTHLPTEAYLRSLVYRFHHVTADAPTSFAAFEAGAGVRTPAEIVRHMTGLLEFTLAQLKGKASDPLTALTWDEELARFGRVARRLGQQFRTGDEPEGEVALEALWRGPLSDVMTHIGQLATLRRLAGSPVERVRYWQVEMPPL